MFERDVLTVPQLSKEQREARAFYQQVEEAEARDDIPKAMKLYNRAYKLDRSLEQVRRQQASLLLQVVKKDNSIVFQIFVRLRRKDCWQNLNI